MQRIASVVLATTLSLAASSGLENNGVRPGARVLMDAHNCYPYHQEWADRIGRALATGAPLAIEQDLTLYTDPRTGASRLVLSHHRSGSASDPTLEAYFFERLRPLMTSALAQGNQGDWPLVTLNLDFKTQTPATLEAMAALLKKYQEWLTTSVREPEMGRVQRLEVKPILVLAGAGRAQQQAFYDAVPVGGRVAAFGAVSAGARPVADNYHRWINYAWGAVERGGPAWAGFWSQGAGEGWSGRKQARLEGLVQAAHQGGLWIRFYSLDGGSRGEARRQGWSAGYNFGSAAKVERRWSAAQQAGVDFIASDEYQRLAAFLRGRAEGRGTAATWRAQPSAR